MNIHMFENLIIFECNVRVPRPSKYPERTFTNFHVYLHEGLSGNLGSIPQVHLVALKMMWGSFHMTSASEICWVYLITSIIYPGIGLCEKRPDIPFLWKGIQYAPWFPSVFVLKSHHLVQRPSVFFSIWSKSQSPWWLAATFGRTRVGVRSLVMSNSEIQTISISILASAHLL
jgi:hypothetical protein